MRQVLQEEIDEAISFFRNNREDVLADQARKFNEEQPNFTGTVLAMEMHGLARDKVEDLLESLFVVYYVFTVLRKLRIGRIGIGQLKKNIESFAQFLKYYHMEKSLDGSVDRSKVTFIKDRVILVYAATTLSKILEHGERYRNEVVFPYMALLRAIEHGAEKAG
jgi:hypothetical protein